MKRCRMFAQVCNLGYRIIISGRGEIYRAGNHPLDSQAYLSTDDSNRVSLEILKEFAKDTLDEMANDKKMFSIFKGDIEEIRDIDFFTT